MIMEQVIYQDLGEISYEDAWQYQRELHQALVDVKRFNRELSADDPERKPRVHYLLFCEHPPVYTLGKSGKMDNLLLNDEQLAEREIEFFKTNRGGDITYHGPGQIVGYPIFDLDGFFTDVHRYVRSIEEVIIRTLADYGLKGERIEKYTGVWLAGDEKRPARKICAIGVHLSRWVTMHGFAFNIKTELDYFNNIIPCGINEEGKDVTSLEKELGREVDMEEVKAHLRRHFSGIFGFELAEEDSTEEPKN
jgi:lipoyl(octanoyl) transferase